MKRLALIISASIVALLTGCIVTSVFPFYTQKDLVTDAALPGQHIGTPEFSPQVPRQRERLEAGFRAKARPLARMA